MRQYRNTVIPGEWTDDHANFPETYDWHRLNSIGLTLAANRIVNAICDDMDTPDRNLVPGLREALRLILWAEEKRS